MSDPKTGPAPEEPAARKGKRRLTSEALFEGSNEVVIVHAGEEYRLRITKNAKLILTK